MNALAEDTMTECSKCLGGGFLKGNVPCPECEKRLGGILFQKLAIRSREGRIIDRPFLSEMVSSGLVKREFARLSDEGKSCFMVGTTGLGKSLCLKRAHNDKLKETGGRGVFYIKERELFTKFREEKSAEEFLKEFLEQKPRHLYFDECFRPTDWRDYNSDRDKAKLAHLYYYAFWDEYIHDAFWNIETIMGTGNALPQDVIPQVTPNDKGLLRRIREGFKL